MILQTRLLSLTKTFTDRSLCQCSISVEDTPKSASSSFISTDGGKVLMYLVLLMIFLLEIARKQIHETNPRAI
jgi:hypothetical protein